MITSQGLQRAGARGLPWTTVEMFEDVRLERADAIARVSIERVRDNNSLRLQTLRDLRAAIDAAEADHHIGVILLTGAGETAFCAGGASSNPSKADACLGEFAALERTILSATKPVVAVVTGYALGAGQVLQLICDLTIASDTAIFGQTGHGASRLDRELGANQLAHLVGHKRAREICYLCRQYTAEQALTMGLVNVVVPAERLMEEATRWCRELLAQPRGAIGRAKSEVSAAIGTSPAAAAINAAAISDANTGAARG